MKYILFLSILFTGICHAQGDPLNPHLLKEGSFTRLIVAYQPFIILGGELGNSTASSTEYMSPVWPKLTKMNLNTVIAPVYWELMEPQEGKFDFQLVDDLIDSARK
jgi:beta-galactosidase GanA